METYTKRERNRYLIGLSGQNILYGIITSAFAYYLQFTILIPAFWVGIILSVSRVFDAVKDPFVGVLINNSKYSQKQLLIALPIPTAILTILCFTNEVYSASNSTISNILIIAFAFAVYLVWEIVFTFGDIPITAYPSLLTTVERDKTKLLSLRPIGMMACSISTLAVQPIAFKLSPLLGGNVTSERNAFMITVAIFSIIGGLLFQLTAIGSKQRVTVNNESGKKQYRYFITNPLLRKITISGVLGSMKSMTGVVLTPLVTYYFSSKDPSSTLFYTVLFGAGSFIGMVVSMIFVPKLTLKFGNINVFIYSNLLCIAPNILLFILYLRNPKNMADTLQVIIMFILTLVIGSCISVSSTVQTLIISDAVELEYSISGNRPAALFFSMQTFIVKIGTGISSLIASLSYVIIHFSSNETAVLNKYISNGGIPRLNDNYSTLMLVLFFLYTIPVAISSLLSVFPFLNFSRNKSVKCL